MGAGGGGYNPAKESTSYFLNHVSKNLDKTFANYDHVLILGDPNAKLLRQLKQLDKTTYMLQKS